MKVLSCVCGVCDIAYELTFSLRREVPGYSDMVETNEALVFI